MPTSEEVARLKEELEAARQVRDVQACCVANWVVRNDITLAMRQAQIYAAAHSVYALAYHRWHTAAYGCGPSEPPWGAEYCERRFEQVCAEAKKEAGNE